MSNFTPIGRRGFILGLTVVGSAVAVASVPALRRRAFGAGSSSLQSVGKTSDFRVGDYKRVALDSGANVYVAESAEKPGTYLAFSTLCTHKGCEVLWVPTAKKFRCPCHGGVFDAAGQVVAGPPPSPLNSLKTKVQDGNVMVSA